MPDGSASGSGFLGSSVVFVHNALAEPVAILSEGVPVDTVGPDATARLAVSPEARSGLRWRLVQPGHPPIGEPMEGPLPAFRRVRGRRVAQVTAEVGGQSYFAPLITNTSPSDITLEVNPGTRAAVRCSCLVPKGAVRARIGYYRLYVNSVVAAYNSAHPYSGPHVDRAGFAAGVAPRNGVVVLTF